jgi:TRAP-type mannitol/chloroaromatic compound transport system permease small subunit
METSQLLMGGMVFLSWAYTLSKRGHVTVDILFIGYPKRIQAALYFIMMIISLALFSLICWKSGSVAISDWQAGKLVRIILIPVAPFKALVSLGALLLCLECMIQMTETLPKMFRGKEG